MKRLLLAVAVILVWGLTSAQAAEKVGVLVLSQGSDAEWNRDVVRTVREAALPYPTEVFFGACISLDDIKRLQKTVHKLERKDVHTIVAIPLQVSAFSEVYRQWTYLLGTGVKPGFIVNPVFPLTHKVEIQFMEPLNDDPFVSDILVDRAQEISQNPSRETVFIVAQGQLDDQQNLQWMDMLERVAMRMRSRASFNNVIPVTMRAEGSFDAKGNRLPGLRERVEAVNKKNGKALILPLSLEPTSLESRMRIGMKGLDYVANPKALLPHPRISQWIRSKAP